jgi:pimeloyl-ACP methyl ester carboxylesterase
MSAAPQVKYAKTEDGVYIAYQTVVDGSLDLIFCPEWTTHIEVWWENPRMVSWLRRMNSFSRLILFDKRGIGLSDPVAPNEAQSLEAWMDDVRAVLDACGSERAALLGQSHGGLMAMLFAATYPERTAALVLVNTYARMSRAPDYPWGYPPDDYELLVTRSDRVLATLLFTDIVDSTRLATDMG